MSTQVKILTGFFVGIASIFLTNLTPHMQDHAHDHAEVKPR